MRTIPAAKSLALFMVLVTTAASGDGHAPVRDFAYRLGDRSVVAWNILTPGTGHHLPAAEVALQTATGTPAPHTFDQAPMYDALVQGAATLTLESLGDFYKDASLGVRPEDVVRVYHPRPGVLVARDRFGVPHVYGATRSDLAFGAGYVSAEDRIFYMDTFRHIGRGRLTELLGASDANLASDRSVRQHADYTEEEMEAQLDRLATSFPDQGARIVGDLEAATDGINAFILQAIAEPATRLPAEYLALQQLPLPWKVTDFVALHVFASWGFAAGGSQLATARTLSAIEEQGYGPAEARAIFDDMRMSADPEAPTTADDPYPLNTDLGPIDPAAVARPDDAAAAAVASAPAHVDGPFGPIALRPWPGVPMSNFLGITAAMSATGRPLVVGGPQVGYLDPAVVMEIDLHAPGISARGISFPGLYPTYPLIGRGPGYAWTGTSPSVDQSDIRALRLCEMDGSPATTASTAYLRDGVCTAMDLKTDTWLAKPGAGGVPDPANPNAVVVTMTTERTALGNVQSRGTVGGEPVAFVLQRATAGREMEFALMLVDLIEPARVTDVAEMQRQIGRAAIAANMLVFDGRDIAYLLTGFTPKLALGVDAELPFWGDSRWDWRGILSFEELPQSFNPPKGWVTNWNNMQAPGFRSETYGNGPVHRSQLLDREIAKAAAGDGKVDIVELAKAAQETATQDVRGVEVLPLMLDALGDPGSLAEVHDMLASWAANGAHRRDLDGDGLYDEAPAYAVFKRWWPRALRAVFEPVLRGAYGRINPREGHLHKDLRQVLGRPVAAPMSRTYCGGGDPDACADVLRETLQETVDELVAAYGADPSAWDAEEDRERISYVSLASALAGELPLEAVTGPPRTGQYQNRPTFQQVLEFE